jgi:hypothetical protein
MYFCQCSNCSFDKPTLPRRSAWIAKLENEAFVAARQQQSLTFACE